MASSHRSSSTRPSSNASRVSVRSLVNSHTPPSASGHQRLPSVHTLLAQANSSSHGSSSTGSRSGSTPGKMKRMWTSVEDRRLRQLAEVSAANWNIIAVSLPGRTGKQCRERWLNHLRPDIRKGNWTEEEDRIILREQRARGNRWSEIARMLPGRSDNAVKNHYYSTLTRKYGPQM